MDGWALADKNKNKQALHGSLAAGEARLVLLLQDVQLSDKGGIITLLNPDGLKVDGVSHYEGAGPRRGLDGGLLDLGPKEDDRRGQSLLLLPPPIAKVGLINHPESLGRRYRHDARI